MKTIVRLSLLLIVILVLPHTAYSQLFVVSGYVKNCLTGQTLETATVYEAFSGIGTITNSDGYYRLLLNRGPQNLKISRAGYETFISDFKMDSDTVISVDLIPQNLFDNKVVAGNKLKIDSTKAEENLPMVRKRK